jgi:hypothetical protein
MPRFVVGSPFPQCSGKARKASYGPRKIRTAGIEAYVGILRSKNAASAFSKHRPKHSDARVTFSLHSYLQRLLSGQKKEPSE